MLCCIADAKADLVADPGEIDFWIGSIGVTSGPRYLSLRNTGGTTLTVVDLTPINFAFARAGGSCGNVPFALAPQASCTLGYTFTPVLVGPTSATLRATPDVGNFVNFRLLGQGEVGGLRTHPGQLIFPDERLGATVGPRDVTLRNTGPDSVTVVQLTPASGVFARDGGSCGAVPFTLASQASCTLGYTFTPSSISTFLQTLRATPDAGQPVDFGLNGTGDFGRLVVEPSSITVLEPIPVGTVGPEFVVNLTNIRGVSMDVTGITTSNPQAAASFVRTGGTCPQPPYTLLGLGQCTIAYTFAPVEVGKIDLQLGFSNSTSSPEPLRLYGTGLPGTDLLSDGFEDL